MLARLLERVASHTVTGEPDECWGWNASTLPNGRPRLGIRVGGRTRSATAARVIAAERDGLELFDASPRWVARHSCDNVSCVNPAHILPGTYAQNTADMWDRGRGARGDRRPSAKLDAEKVREIRRRARVFESQSAIGKTLGVSQSLVSQVVRGKVWGWVE